MTHATSTHARLPVVLYVDPSCPFAWITSRWLLEVAALRPIEVEFRLMSLSVLNEHRELEPWYREFNNAAWGPVRIAAAVQALNGTDAFADFYSAYGIRKHNEQEADRMVAAAGALAAAELPAELIAAAVSGDFDPALRHSHEQVRELVGDELGTPVIVVGDAAFFGPVCTAIARGDAALALFDAVLAAARCSVFAELKRGRSADLAFA